MKLSKTLLNAMLIAVTTGTVISCEKPRPDEEKKPAIHHPKSGPESNIPEGCPACGMG